MAREPRTLPADSPPDRKLLDDTGDVALAALAADGTVLNANDAFCALCGRTRDEVVGASIASLLAGGDGEAVSSALGALAPGIRSAAPGSGAGSGRSRTVDVQFRDAGGNLRGARLVLGPVDDEALGEPGAQGSPTGQAAPAGAPARAVCMATPERPDRRRTRVTQPVPARTPAADPASANHPAAQVTVGPDGIRAAVESACQRAAKEHTVFTVIHLDAVDPSTGSAEAAVHEGERDRSGPGEALEAWVERVRSCLRPGDTLEHDGDGLWVLAEELGDEQDAAGITYRVLATTVGQGGPERGMAPRIAAGTVVADGLATAEVLLFTARSAAARARGPGGFELVDLRRG